MESIGICPYNKKNFRVDHDPVCFRFFLFVCLFCNCICLPFEHILAELPWEIEKQRGDVSWEGGGNDSRQKEKSGKLNEGSPYCIPSLQNNTACFCKRSAGPFTVIHELVIRFTLQVKGSWNKFRELTLSYSFLPLSRAESSFLTLCFAESGLPRTYCWSRLQNIFLAECQTDVMKHIWWNIYKHTS